MASKGSAPTRLRGLVDRNREHRSHCATHLLDIARFLRRNVWGDMDLMRDVGACVDGLVYRNGEHRAHAVRTFADLIGVVVYPLRICYRFRGIGIGGVIRGDRKHLSHMVDATSDFLSEGFL